MRGDVGNPCATLRKTQCLSARQLAPITSRLLANVPLHVFSGAVLAGQISRTWKQFQQFWPTELISVETVGLAVSKAFMSFTGMLSTLVHDMLMHDESPSSYLFGGWSLGGNLAMEVSRLFCMSNLHVPATFFLDPRGVPPFIYQETALASSHKRSVMTAQFTRLGLDVRDVSTLGP